MHYFIYDYFNFSDLGNFWRVALRLSRFPIVFLLIIGFHYRFDFEKLKNLFYLKPRAKRLRVSMYSVLFFFVLVIAIPALLFFLWFVINNKPIEVSFYEYPLSFFLSTLLIAPIFEELVFRRVIAHGLFKKYGFKKAVVWSSFLFLLVHFPLKDNGLFFLFMGGVLLAYVYLKTRNIYLVMVLHFLTNLNSIINSYRPHFFALEVNSIYRTNIPYFWIYYTFCFFGLIFLARVSYRYINNYYKLYVSEE